MKTLTLAALVAALLSPALAGDELLQIRKDEMSMTVETEDGPVEITRRLTDCALNKGWLQPMVPVEGAHVVGEIEVLEALADPATDVIDMRTIDWRVRGTIPGSIHIPYTEVADRLDALGCTRAGDGWDCANARRFIGFCNGPVCPQSPMAMKAAHREGFPADRMYYYRGGMLDWQALGLTTVEGMF